MLAVTAVIQILIFLPTFANDGISTDSEDNQYEVADVNVSTTAVNAIIQNENADEVPCLKRKKTLNKNLENGLEV